MKLRFEQSRGGLRVKSQRLKGQPIRLGLGESEFSKSIPLRSRSSADILATLAEALTSPVGSSCPPLTAWSGACHKTAFRISRYMRRGKWCSLSHSLFLAGALTLAIFPICSLSLYIFFNASPILGCIMFNQRFYGFLLGIKTPKIHPRIKTQWPSLKPQNKI